MGKFKVTATVQWVVDLPTACKKEIEREEIAFSDLQQILGENVGRFTFLQIDKLDQMKDRKGRRVLGEFSIDDVLPFVGKVDRKTYTIDNKEYTVKMNSHRYFIFRASKKCVSCGLVGSVMLLEMHSHDTTPHFNMYARDEDGELVLMTKDHICPKTSGGADRHSNYQTMCSICNNIKGADSITIEETRELRELYRVNSKKVTRKELHKIIRAAKDEMLAIRAIKEPQPNIHDNTIVAKCDLNIYREEDGTLRCSTVYEGLSCNGTHIACLKKGSCLYPIRAEDEKFVIEFGKEALFIHRGLTEHYKF